MLFGAGQLFVQTKELDANSLRGENLVFPLCIASFELTFEENLLEAKCLTNGKRQISSAAISESIAALNLSFEYTDFNTLGFALDEIPSTETAVTIPTIRSATAVDDGVDSADVTDPDIVGTEVVGEDILVYVASKNLSTYGDRQFLTAADVTVVAGALELPQIYANAVIQYTFPKTYATIDTIGVSNNFDRFGKLFFSGIISGTEFGTGSSSGMQIIVPELSRVSTPSLSVTGDLVTLDVEFRASVPAGKRSPYELYLLETAT